MSEKVKIELNDERHSLPNDNSRFIKLDVILSDTMWPLKKPILVPRRQRNKKSYLKSLSLLSSKCTRTTRTLTSADRCSVKRKRYITSDNLRMENNTIDTAKLEKSFKKPIPLKLVNQTSPDMVCSSSSKLQISNSLDFGKSKILSNDSHMENDNHDRKTYSQDTTFKKSIDLELVSRVQFDNDKINTSSQISCLGKRVHKLINTSTSIKNNFLPVGKKL